MNSKTLIEKYLNNELTAQEGLLIEEKLLVDDAFKKEYLLSKKIKQSLEKSSNIKIVNQLSALEQELESENYYDTFKKEKSKKRFIPLLFILGLLLVGAYLINQKLTQDKIVPQKFYAELLTNDKEDVSKKIAELSMVGFVDQDLDFKGKLTEALQLLEEENYESSISKLSELRQEFPDKVDIGQYIVLNALAKKDFDLAKSEIVFLRTSQDEYLIKAADHYELLLALYQTKSSEKAKQLLDSHQNAINIELYNQLHLLLNI